ncbi:MAG: hypothetical protein IPM51_02835 [Sphingobacteriaceae bacterium]|nr:hypothetical protein [Sphingobacteriaceae bacterium]
MKNKLYIYFRFLTLKFFVLSVFFIKLNECNAQSLNATFKYSRAEYQHTEKLIRLSFKDETGEVFYFHILKNENIDGKENLYNIITPIDTNLISINVTNQNLIGKMIRIKYDPINEIDPANPYCCYKIRSFKIL